jgi:hypothetical protein
MKTFYPFLILLLIVNLAVAQENGGPYTADNNTVLLMHFDGNATNSAAVGNNGIVHGTGVSYETGIHGQALRLDNSTSDKQSWIEVPYFDELNISEEFSIECWFKVNSWGEAHTFSPILFRKGESWPADYSAGLGAMENTLWARLNCQNDEYNREFDTGTLPEVINKDEWYHMSLTFKPQTETRYWMYMDLLIRDKNYNEVFVSTGFGPTPPFNSNEKLFIGFGNNDNSYFDGWIDEFRISNKKREYRDDIIAEINTADLKDSVPQMLRDRWTTYYPQITNYFPIDTVTGVYEGNSCGMTIMIRLLHYWEHPRFPSGNIDYWFGPVHWQADLDNTEYLFDLMPDKFGSNPTEEEYAPSAKLAQQVSAVTRIYFDNMSSMPQFLEEYFHYKKGMKLYFRHQFTKEEWIKIFKNELSHGRPIMAAGLEEVYDEGGAAGHYYIVDGYNSEGKFHSDESFGDVDFWVDIDSFPYGKFQTIIIGAEPDWNEKTLTLNYPKGGECLLKETELEIKWDSENIYNVLLEYSSDAGKNWQTIATNIQASEGSYLWTLPETFSKNYKVRISDTEDGNIYRRSNTFEVYETQNLKFEYPEKNTTLNSGKQHPLYWQSTGIKNIRIEYSVEPDNWEILCDSALASQNNISVPIPEGDYSEIVLKATDLTNNNLFFYSDTFKIEQSGAVGDVNKADQNTLVILHFEENLKNEAQNIFTVKEGTLGQYNENYKNNLGKSYRVDNSKESNGGSHLFISNSEEINLENNWTIETWVKLKSAGDALTGYFPIIIEKGDVFGIFIDQNYFASKNGFHAYLNFENETSITFFQNQSMDFDKWYHVALISDSASQSINFYVHDEDRNLIYEAYQPFPEGSSGELKQNQNIITLGGIGGASNRQFDGWLDEVLISKSAHLTDFIETVELPFFDDFEEDISDGASFQKWITQNLEGWHYWHIISGQGMDYSQCMRFENNDTDQNDWLITKALNCSDYSKLTVNFNVFHNGSGERPKLFYKSLTYDNKSASDWKELSYSLGSVENEWYSVDEITINDPGDIIYFAFHSEQTANQGIYFLLDNFSIQGILTGNKLKPFLQNDFKVFPNPITSESIISFQTKINENVNLSIFDIQGRKICTMLDENLNAGTHTIPLKNSIPSGGIYFCKLATSEGVSVLKFVVK